MRLLGAPKDILLNVFSLLQIQDLLALERTCSFLRTAVASRYLWLSQLQRLVDQACTPGLPSYVDIEQLRLSEIRSLVLGTHRWIKSRSDSKRDQTSVSIKSKTTVMIETPRNVVRLSDNPKNFFYRLTPGGKLLFLADRGCLEVFDVQEGVCVWNHAPSSNEKDVKLMGFAFEGCSDTIFRIFIVSLDSKANSILLELFQLEGGQGEDKVVVHPIAQDTSQRGPDDSIYINSVCMGEDFTAMFMTSTQTRSVIIWNWKTGELSDIILSSDADLYDLQIMRGHLFYTLYSKTTHWRLETFSLRQFEDSAPLIYLTDIKSSYFDISSLYSWLTGTPQIVLYDLSRFGTTKAIKIVLVAKAFYETVQMSAHVADHFEFALEHSDTCEPTPSPIRHIRTVRPVMCTPFMSTVVLAASLSGCVVRNANDVVYGNQWRLQPNASIRLLGFNEQGEFYRSTFGGWTQTSGVVAEFGCGAIVQSILEDGPKRIVIHHLI